MLKKRILGALAALAIGTMALTGCGDVGSAPEKSADKTPAAASQVDKSIPTSAIKVEGGHVEMSLFAGSLPQNTPTGEALGLMAEYINKNANGTIKAEAFYDTALGDATSMVQGLQQGTIDGLENSLQFLDSAARHTTRGWYPMWRSISCRSCSRGSMRRARRQRVPVHPARRFLPRCQTRGSSASPSGRMDSAS